MHDGVRSDKGKRIALKTDKEGQCLSGPLSLIVEGRKNVLGGVVCRREIHQRHQDAEKTQNVNDQDKDFDGRQSPTGEHIDKNT